MDVPLPTVLLLLVLVGLMVVLHGGVVVLVIMAGVQMAPVLAVREVVDDVMVLVGVDGLFVAVPVGHRSSSVFPFEPFLPPSLTGHPLALVEPAVVGNNRDGHNARRSGMGFKSGLLVGFGVGYVLGSKAGRERYDEIRSAWDQFVGNPQVQRVVTKSREVVDTGVQRGIRAVEDASDDVKTRLEGPSGASGTSTTTS
jgi:hypothetical protein